MRLTWRVFASAALLGVAACKGFPFPWRTEPDPGAEDSARVRLELQGIRYDGWTLNGRLLVTPETGSLRLDKRLIENTALSTRSVTDCMTGQPVEFMVMDVFARPPQAEDMLVLEPGYWYGKDIRIPLIAETPDRLRGPECIEADIVFHARGKTTALLHVRAEIPSQPPADAGLPTDGGEEAPTLTD